MVRLLQKRSYKKPDSWDLAFTKTVRISILDVDRSEIADAGISNTEKAVQTALGGPGTFHLPWEIRPKRFVSCVHDTALRV